MFLRLGVSLAAALALAAVGANACECHRAVRHVVVHVAPHRVVGCHCRVSHVRYVRRWRERLAPIERPAVYRSDEDWTGSSVSEYRSSDESAWSSRGYGEGYGYDADAHLSATDRYGYLTWPGKDQPDEDYGRGGCDSACAPAYPPYAEIPDEPSAAYGDGYRHWGYAERRDSEPSYRQAPDGSGGYQRQDRAPDGYAYPPRSPYGYGQPSYPRAPQAQAPVPQDIDPGDDRYGGHGGQN